MRGGDGDGVSSGSEGVRGRERCGDGDCGRGGERCGDGDCVRGGERWRK